MDSSRVDTPPLTSAIDCWSLGVVIYLCLSGRFPFKSRDNVITPNFKRANLNGIITFNETHWTGVSNAAKSVVLGLLTVDPRTRLTAADVLKHPWVRDLASARARARAGTPGRNHDCEPSAGDVPAFVDATTESEALAGASRVAQVDAAVNQPGVDANEEFEAAREAPPMMPFLVGMCLDSEA